METPARSREASLAGYQAALGAALAIHSGYPANRAALAGKQAGPAAYKVPVEMPTLAGKYGRELDWQGKVVPSCVHCHQIGDAHREAFRAKGQPIPPEWIYPMPPPETIGLTLDPDTVARVTTVESGSVAAAVGFKPGDELVAANGAPLLSAADLAWALHRSPDPGTLRLLTRRAGAERELVVKLEAGWRGNVDISTRVGTWAMRAMALGGMKLESLSDAERAALKVPGGGLALRLKHVGQYGKHAAAKNAGFRKDDVLVAVEGVTGNLDESQLIGRLLAAHPTPAKLKATVVREGKRVELLLPVQ